MKKILSFSLFIFIFSAFTLITYTANADTQHQIGIKKFKFTPAEITINVGDSIRWTNKEKRQYHSVWFKKLGDPEPDYLFPGDFYDKSFDKVGDYPYRCGPHPKMTGMVHVVKAGDKKENKGSIQNPKESKKDKQAATFLVESIEDGDTLVIYYKGKTQRVQLIGIDAPESTQNPKLNLDSQRKGIKKTDLLEMGKQATEYLKTLVAKNEKVSLLGKLTQKDKYNRLPAVVINAKGESLNQLMVEGGYALLLSRFPINETLKKTLETAQKKAKTEQKGLWKSHSVLMKKWSE